MRLCVDRTYGWFDSETPRLEEAVRRQEDRKPRVCIFHCWGSDSVVAHDYGNQQVGAATVTVAIVEDPETGRVSTVELGYVQFIANDDIEDFVDIVDARAAAKEAIRRGTIPWTQLRAELLERKDRVKARA